MQESGASIQSGPPIGRRSEMVAGSPEEAGVSIHGGIASNTVPDVPGLGKARAQSLSGALEGVVAVAVIAFARIITAVRGIWAGCRPEARPRIYYANHT